MRRKEHCYETTFSTPQNPCPFGSKYCTSLDVLRSLGVVSLGLNQTPEEAYKTPPGGGSRLGTAWYSLPFADLDPLHPLDPYWYSLDPLDLSPLRPSAVHRVSRSRSSRRMLRRRVEWSTECDGMESLKCSDRVVYFQTHWMLLVHLFGLCTTFMTHPCK